MRMLRVRARIWAVTALAVWFASTPGRAAEGEQAGKRAPKPAAKPMLKMRAKSIFFSRSKGDLKLDGEVHVTRTVGEQSLSVDCDKMTAKMKDGKMETVVATGNVTVATPEVEASAATAEFDFVKNVITLRGSKEKPATMKTLTDPVIVSTGPTIVFHVDEERVEMPDGGDTEIPLEEPKPAGKKKAGKGT